MSDLARAAAQAARTAFDAEQRGDGGPAHNSGEEREGEDVYSRGEQPQFCVEDIPTSRRSGDHARLLSTTDGANSFSFDKNGVSF